MATGEVSAFQMDDTEMEAEETKVQNELLV